MFRAVLLVRLFAARRVAMSFGQVTAISSVVYGELIHY